MQGVDTDRSYSNLEADVNSPLGCKPEALVVEHAAWMRYQQYLSNLTEHALRKNQHLVIVNMMHDKEHLLSAKDLAGVSSLSKCIYKHLISVLCLVVCI